MAPLVWFITGCSSGIGEALARAVLAQGDQVVATARAPIERLDSLKQAGATVIELDVTASVEAMKAVTDKAIAAYGHIDVVVPNAGHSEATMLEEVTPDIWQRQFAVTFFGVVNVIQCLLPHFRARRSGVIAYTNSVFGHAMSLGAGPYTVSKHAIAGYAKSLAIEVGGFGIKSILFDIGFIRNRFLEHINPNPVEMEEYKPIMEQAFKGVELMKGNQPGDVDKCAGAMITVVKSASQPLAMVPLGTDATLTIRKYASVLTNSCDEWEQASESVDVDGPKQGLWQSVEQYWPL